MESQGLAGDWIKRVCLVWPFPCLGSNGLWGHIPAGIASCIEAMWACLLGSSWIWIQAAYGLVWLWRTIHRCKCRISLLQRQLLASLSLCLHICVLHQWVLCLWKLWVCCFVGVLHLGLPGKHRLVWSQAVMGQSIWGWCHWWWLAWLAQKQPHNWHSKWSQHLFSGVLTEGQLGWTGHGSRGSDRSPYQGTLRAQWTFMGAGRACTASTFSGSGCTPLASYREPKKFTARAFTCIFCGSNTTPYLQATCMRLHRWSSCSAQCNHVWWCHQWFWCIQGILWGTGPSSSGRCPVSRPDQREDAGNGTFQRGCWR